MKALLKLNVDFWHNVDWSGRREDSCGSSGIGETPQALAPRRLTARPAESEAPEAEINILVFSIGKLKST
ncbi:hypothetical protein [Bacillus sp. 1NLA3E]|uniref:hypothetical protein n=1 Tax=Bacillus sp. 1NLA3E TaxID=666686 RepID=UPI000247F4AC|nr:hypothetical protein [Bacillus sp. 1NLA3E]AGK54645.1 hypothetical protein B1NLA3E_14495 [Bacillus sp. 1NLA3E]